MHPLNASKGWIHRAARAPVEECVHVPAELALVVDNTESKARMAAVEVHDQLAECRALGGDIRTPLCSNSPLPTRTRMVVEDNVRFRARDRRPAVRSEHPGVRGPRAKPQHFGL